MKIGLTGTSYKKTLIKDMEPIYIGKEGAQKVLNELKPDSPFAELVILTTCNRLEFYYVAEDVALADQWIRDQIIKINSQDITLFSPHDVPDLYEAYFGLAKR